MAEMLDLRGAAAAKQASSEGRPMARRGARPMLREAAEPTLSGALGWLPDLPDFRDYTPEHPEVQPHLERAKVTAEAPRLPASVDLRPWCTSVENQLDLGSCTAQAGAAMYEYFVKRAFGREFDLSRLFLYKATRNLLRWEGDTGAYLRTTMGAMAFFGMPPEEYWPYDIANFDVEPPAFCYAFAQSFQALVYYRLDPPGVTPDALLARIKAYLAAGLPSMFGFTVYGSIAQAATTGKIPFPAQGERVLGGHAVLAVGYDDGMKIRNANPGGAESTGALLVRNSWGATWGAAGYGWLPYDFVLRELALDWWSMLKGEWIDTGAFRL